MQDIVHALTPPERRAVALVATMIRLYGGREGTGLFTGVSRYAVLQGRVRLCAETSRGVGQWWDRTTAAMRWPITASRHDAPILTLIGPAPDDGETLRALAERSDSVIRLARQIARAEREAAGIPPPPPALPTYDDPLDAFGALDAGAADAAAAPADQE